MKKVNKMYKKILLLFFLLIAVTPLISQTRPYHYQGKLVDNNVLANGSYDFIFSIWNHETSTNIVNRIWLSGNYLVNVQNGLYTAKIEIPTSALNDYENIWLQVEVRPSGSGSYETLARTEITGVPYALVANALVGDVIDLGGNDALTLRHSPRSNAGDGTDFLIQGQSRDGTGTLGGNILLQPGLGSTILNNGSIQFGRDQDIILEHTPLTSNGNGNDLFLRGQDKYGTGTTGGDIIVEAGTGSSGGDIHLLPNPSGGKLLLGGNYDLTIQHLALTSDGDGNDLTIDAQDIYGTGTNGGDIILDPGDGDAVQNNGVVEIRKGLTMTGFDPAPLDGQMLQTNASGSITFTYINNDALESMPSYTLKGNNTTSEAKPIDLTVNETRVLLDIDNVENTALTTWAGTANITTLGTIVTGTWAASDVAVIHGGTGTSNGSIEGTSTLNFTTQSNNNIQLLPNGTGKTIIKKAVINESANDYSLPTGRGTSGQFMQTDGSGAASWATLTASNGLTKTGNDIELGGTLTENTTVAQAGFNMIYNLTGAGDFAVQDNGTDVFKVSGDGSVTFNQC